MRGLVLFFGAQRAEGPLQIRRDDVHVKVAGVRAHRHAGDRQGIGKNLLRGAQLPLELRVVRPVGEDAERATDWMISLVILLLPFFFFGYDYSIPVSGFPSLLYN